MKEIISAKQLLSAIILVPLGSGILFFIASDAKQDSWIVILIYIIPGIVLQIIYTSLWKRHPNDTIVTYMPKIFGKFVGYTISILYILFFAYIAARVLRDFSELILLAMMPREPLIVISTLFALVVGFSIYSGFENLCRISYIFICLLILFFAAEWIFLSTTPDTIKFSNLKPVLENGIFNITKKSWILIAFPYGESVLFTMFYPYVKEKTMVRKATIIAIILIGLLLSFNTILFTTVLGVNYASTSLIPQLQVLRIMQIGATFDRVDVIFILIIVLIGFLKISFLAYGSMLGFAQILKLKKTKHLALPFTLVILITSQIIASNYAEHIYIGLKIIPQYMHIPLEVIIPTIALLVYYIKRFIHKLKT